MNCLFACVTKCDCTAKLTKWPFDTQTCYVEFSNALAHDEFIFNAENDFELEEKKLNTKTWNLTHFSINTEEGKFIVFDLKRNCGSYVISIICMGYVLIASTLFLPWISSDQPLRRILCGVNILLHFSLMDRVWWQIPYASENPKIVIFMSVMLVLAFLVQVESILVGNLEKSQRSELLLVAGKLENLQENLWIKIALYNPLDNSNGTRIMAKLIDRGIFFILIIIFFWAKVKIFDAESE